MLFQVLEDTSIDSSAIMDGANTNFGDGALASLLSIAMVFAILLVIIGITTLIFKLLGLFEMKKEIDEFKKNGTPVSNGKLVNNSSSNASTGALAPVVIADEDMMVAALVASIDYQNEIKSDVKIKSIKEIK